VQDDVPGPHTRPVICIGNRAGLSVEGEEHIHTNDERERRTNKQYLFMVEDFSSSDYTASNGRMINELEMISQEAIMAYFAVLHHQHFLGGTEESHGEHRSRQSVFRPILEPNATRKRVYSVTRKPTRSAPHSGQLVYGPRYKPRICRI
jgi:hypothetical protein